MRFFQKPIPKNVVSSRNFKAKNHLDIFNHVPDQPQGFPEEAIEILREYKLLEIGIPRKYLKGEKNKKSSQNLLDILFEIGRADLSVARIYEGHINALLLIGIYGNSSQKAKYYQLGCDGYLFGIWNTESDSEKLQIQQKNKSLFLKGAKTFCSGALHIDFPIITAGTNFGTQMMVFSVKEQKHLQEDWSLWNPIGMRSSVSCRIDFTGSSVSSENFLGKVGDYFREPYFSWGAVRFSAIQIGSARAIFDIVIKDLEKSNRSSDPYQKMRLGKMAILMETAGLWLEKAKIMDQDLENLYSTETKVNFSNMMRTLSLEICKKIISLAETSIGMAGTSMDHPLERKIRDLRVYLKQAGPDAALTRVGEFVVFKKS